MPTSSVHTREITVSELTFECDVAGSDAGQLVLCLHGFPQTSHSYRDLLPALAEVGFLALAPNQRGYSPGARPRDLLAYTPSKLVGDALALADHFEAQRFHLVGHDWGGQIAWMLAARHPERLRSLSVLSRPHPAAFADALREDTEQATRSKHHQAFQDPDMARQLLADDAARLRGMLSRQHVPAPDVEAYLSRLRDPGTMDAALHWYRAAISGQEPLARSDFPNIHVPTLYIW
ncbi:MAG: alpha/beta hydrolase, partial [Polyangiales bacterium]